MPTLRALTLILASLGPITSGCAPSGTVEGVFSGESFALDCAQPLQTRYASKRDRLIVLSDHDGETLSTVNIRLPAVAALPLGAAVEVGAGALDDLRPSLDVVVGDLVTATRADGVEILSSTDARRATSAVGTFTLEHLAEAEVAGRFSVELDDGGFLEGSFLASEPL